MDKTGFIRELFHHPARVTVLARPGKFGKTLTMSMLESFLSPESDRSIFEGLEITRDREFCEKHMGKHPVFSFSLQDVSGKTYEEAYQKTLDVISQAVSRFSFILESDVPDVYERESFRELMEGPRDRLQLSSCLRDMAGMLAKYYKTGAFLLIDAYEAPSTAAWELGYYDEMADLTRELVSSMMQDHGIDRAVLTGTLPVIDEDLIGRVNPSDNTVESWIFERCFGFTDEEVGDLLAYYGLEAGYEKMKEWYKGYLFGNAEVYCPWDVLCHCSALLEDPKAKPGNYWVESNNDLLKHILGGHFREEIEVLLAGKAIRERDPLDPTVKDFYGHGMYEWHGLLHTGYLTGTGKKDHGYQEFKEMTIPNREVRSAFVKLARDNFQESLRKNPELLKSFFPALEKGNTARLTNLFTRFLRDAVTWDQEERFYLEALEMILKMNEDWIVIPIGCTLALSYPGKMLGALKVQIAGEDEDLDDAAERALELIWQEIPPRRNRASVVRFGIGCADKACSFMIAMGGVR